VKHLFLAILPEYICHSKSLSRVGGFRYNERTSGPPS
jgi:hypothetical protein